MKKSSILLFTLLLLGLFFGQLSADFPGKPSRYVTDKAGILDGRTRLQIEALLVELKQKTRAEIAVATVPTLDGLEIEDYAVTLFEKWGIGEKGKDNGLLLLVAPIDRRVRIEVGYGLEGVIPDALAGRVVNEIILPAFKSGKMSQGVALGAGALAGIIAKDANVTLSGGMPTRRASGKKRKASLLEKIFTLLLFIIMIPILIKNPWLLLFLLSSGRGGYRGGGGFGGGFGGFGGGMSGGGGASGSW